MKRKITGDEAAFSGLEQTKNAEYWNTIPGLTIRQEFAKAAMQGILANHWCQNDFKDNIIAMGPDIVAKQAVLYADALITTLSQEG